MEDAGDSVGACDLKTARKGALFWCTVLAGGFDDSDELAVVLTVVDSEMTLLRVDRGIWTRDMLFVSSTMSGEMVGGGFCEKIGGFSSFSHFCIKPVNVEHFASAVVVVEHSSGLRIVVGGVGEGKTVI